MTRDKVSSLMELCLTSSLNYLESSKASRYVFLPEDVCEALIAKRLKEGKCTDSFLSTFSNPSTSRMVRVDLHGAAITDEGLGFIASHPIRDLNVSECYQLTKEGIKQITQCKNSLSSLNLGKCNKIVEFDDVGVFQKLRALDVSNTSFDQNSFEASAPGLSNLQLLNMTETAITDLKPVEHLKSLVSLDLSSCAGLTSVDPLISVQGTLRSLILFNCTGFRSFNKPVEIISQLTNLEHLDMSKIKQEWDSDIHQPYVNGGMLKQLSQLPCLKTLEISGSSLVTTAGMDSFRPPHHRLEFLGLSMSQTCYYADIPADEVSGEANETQVMTSLRRYQTRAKFLLNALRELFNIIRGPMNPDNEEEICRLVAQAMRSFPADHKIQIAGSATLYRLSREEEGNEDRLEPELRRQIIEVTLDAMENHPAEEQLQKNCCLTLCNFRIPDEVQDEYKRVARLLLKAAELHNVDFIQRIAVSLCNLLVCQVTDVQKVVVGRDLQGVKTFLDVIKTKLQGNPYMGGVLDCCWSALWNVTDETPDNCSVFIELGGVELFLQCKKDIENSSGMNHRELQRNMLGLMGNVAEVDSLRPYLMQYLEEFYNLLDNKKYDLEVSYNAAGILCHLASDGVQAWTNTTLDRDETLQRLEEVIEQWNIEAARQISYRSFQPILRLLPRFDTPAIQHWGAWALANLSGVDSLKYCTLLRDENGIGLLEDLVRNPGTNPRTKELARMTLDRCQEHFGPGKEEHASGGAEGAV